MQINTAEKIETVALSRKSGAFGEYVAREDGSARVVVDGRAFIVGGNAYGWTVQAEGGPFVANDTSLIDAAWMATEAA